MDNYLDPLPTDVAHVSSQSHRAHQSGLETVDHIITQLEQAKQQLQSSEYDSTTLSDLSSYVKKSNSTVSSGHKDWSTSLNKLGKSIDKVRKLQVICNLSAYKFACSIEISFCTNSIIYSSTN